MEHTDRFSRFGMNYITKLMEMMGRKIEVINLASNDRDDLMLDFVAIITSFFALVCTDNDTINVKLKKLIKELTESETC